LNIKLLIKNIFNLTDDVEHGTSGLAVRVFASFISGDIADLHPVAVSTSRIGSHFGAFITHKHSGQGKNFQTCVQWPSMGLQKMAAV
jgi:hypothetical protein